MRALQIVKLQDFLQYACKLVSAGCAFSTAIYSLEQLGGSVGVHTFEKAAYGLEISVAAANVADIVKSAFTKVEIYLRGADKAARYGFNVS